MSSWLHFDFDDLDSGYLYCCSVPDAHRTIKVSLIKKSKKIIFTFVQSMPAVPENSRLLTGILDSDSVEDLEVSQDLDSVEVSQDLDSVEVSQDLDSVEVSKDRDIESPESISQVIISRCVCVY